MKIISLDIKNADLQTFERLHTLFMRIEAERNPDDPPLSLELLKQRWRNEPDFVKLQAWAVEQSAEQPFVAFAWAAYLETEENRHLMQAMSNVLPEYRRQGLGRQLLGQITKYTHIQQRHLLLFTTSSRVPAGAAFMQAMGATMAMESHSNELCLADINPALLGSWLEAGQKLTDMYTLQFWNSPYTERQIPDMLVLQELVNQAPREDLDVEDFRTTAEQLRQLDLSLIASGQQRWTAVIHERSTGRPVGFTELFLETQRPGLIQQGLTGVFPEFRNHGLGRWLKAAMLERLMRQWPEARIIRTANAGSNAPMLKINTELGFHAAHVQQAWQVELEQAEAFATRA